MFETQHYLSMLYPTLFSLDEKNELLHHPIRRHHIILLTNTKYTTAHTRTTQINPQIQIYIYIYILHNKLRLLLLRAIPSEDAKRCPILHPQTLIYLFYQLILQLFIYPSFYFYIQTNKII